MPRKICASCGRDEPRLAQIWRGRGRGGGGGTLAGVESPSPPTAAQARIVAAALDLFARHGVGGTSLQMIADEIGVTKAAVYHQYRTKDDIILAAAEAELARVDEVVAAAEAMPSDAEAREALIAGVIDLAVARGRTAGTILNDPVIAEFFAGHEMFHKTMHRLRGVLVGGDGGPESAVRVAMTIAAISGAVMHPYVAGLDDETVRAELLRLTRAFLDTPD